MVFEKMKSRCNQTVPSGRQLLILLIVNSVILLLVNSIEFAQSAEIRNPIEPYSWIEVSANNWPGKDSNGDSGEFLVYHSEYVTNSTLFGLNKKLSDDIDLAAIERPELSFRYWSSSDGSLRARSPSGPVRRDVKLGKGSWQDSTTEAASAKTVRTDLKKISKEDWSNFAFISQDVFTLALKDVKVKYVQRVDLEKIETPEITAYNATNNFLNFKDPAVKATPAPVVVPPPGAGGAADPAPVQKTLEKGTYTFDVSSKKATKITFKLGGENVELTIDKSAVKMTNKVKGIFDKSTLNGAKTEYKEVKIEASGQLVISDFKINDAAVTQADLDSGIKLDKPQNPPVVQRTLEKGTYTFDVSGKKATKITFKVGGENVELTIDKSAVKITDKFKGIFDKSTLNGAKTEFHGIKIETSGHLVIFDLKINDVAISQADLDSGIKLDKPQTPPVVQRTLEKGTYTFDVSGKKATKITFKVGGENVELTIDKSAVKVSDKFKGIFDKSTLNGAKTEFHVIKIEASGQLVISDFKINDGAVSQADLDTGIQKDGTVINPSNPTTGPLTYEYQPPNEVTKDLVKGLVQLSEKNPTAAGKDVCYTITKVGSNAPIIDVYLTLKAASIGIKLNTIKSGADSLKVCIFKYVALQNIGDYMISFVVKGEVPNTFKFTLEKDEKTADIQKKSEIVAPFSAVKSDQWYLYNPHFDYSINADAKSEFLICDIVANCYPYELDQNVFKLSSKIQAELVSTPFVRIQTSSTGTFTFVSADETKFYENSRKQFRAKFDVDNAKALKPNPTETQETPTKLTVTYEVAFDATSSEATITVPFDLVDLRVQQLVATLSLDKATHDDVVSKKTKSPLTLTKVNLKKGTDQDFDLPFSLGGDEKVELKSGFTIESDEIFSSELAQVLTGTSATFVLQLDSSVYKTAKVSLKIDILKSARKTAEGKGQAARFTIANTFTNVPKADKVNTNQVALEPKSNALLATSWIQSSDAASNAAVDTSFKIEVVTPADKTKLTDASKIEIFRVVVDQDKNPKVSDKLFSAFKDNVITFTQTDAKVDVKGSFRVAYLIHSNEELQLKITVDKLDVTGAVGAKDSENCKKEATKLFADCQYETLTCASTFGDTDGKACHLSKLNRLAEVKCDMSNGCANILDRRLPVSKRHNFGVSEYIPFQIDPNGTRKDHYLLYNRPESHSTGDFCLGFTYSASESTLTVSAAPNGFGVTLPATPRSNPLQDKEVCASWLTNDVESVYGLYFAFDKMPIFDIDGHTLEILNFFYRNSKESIDNANLNDDDDDDEQLADESPVSSTSLEGGIYINSLEKSQFLLQDDPTRWAIERKELSNVLQFSISSEDLLTLPSNAQGDKYTALYTSSIRTKWIRVPIKDSHLSIGFVYDSGISEFIDYKVQLRVNSPTECVWEGDVSEIKANQLFVVPQTLFDNYYQFEIDVQLNQTRLLEQIKQTPTNLIAGDLTLTLANFSINDPCVNAQNMLEMCSRVNQGECTRTYTESHFTGKCKCATIYHGEHCELTDYCARDKAASHPICKKDMKCANDYEYQQVKCECAEDEVWNSFLFRCIVTKHLNCGANEVLGYDQKCACSDGFVNVTFCVAFDPCNEEHRKAYITKTKNNIPIHACPNAETKCERIGTGTKPTDFTCKCEKGVNDHLIMTPDAKCLPDVCANCRSRACMKSGNDWKCSETDCTAEGFQLDKDKNCILNPKSASLIAKFHCPGEIELKSDNQPGCKCGDQMFDSKTRGCLSECSAEMLNECRNRGAYSCIWNLSDKNAQCACKEGEIPHATNQSDVESWKCIPQCELLSLPEMQQYKCFRPFEHCEPSPYMHNGMTGTKDSYLIKGVFVKDTKFGFSQRELCKCNPGFEFYQGRCLPVEKAIHYIKGMEFELHLNEFETLTGFLESFRHLIQDILVRENIHNPVATCVKTSETTISCSIDFQTDANDKTIRRKLNEACVKVSEDKCVFLQRGAVGHNSLVLVQNFKKVQTEIGIFDYCAQPDICSKFKYTQCRADKAKPFECLCEEKPYFEIEDIVFMGINNNLRMQTCQVKNLCMDSKYSCHDPSALCHFTVEYDAIKRESNALSFCSCPDSGIILAHNDMMCKKTCNAICAHSTTCAEDYVTKEVVCHCEDGWTGDRCDKKLGPMVSNSTTTISPVTTRNPEPSKDQIVTLVNEVIGKAEKDLKTFDEIRQVQIVSEMNKLKDLLKRYEQGAQDELIGELTVHETKLRHLIS